MKKSRTHYAVLNSGISSFIFIINTLLKFIVRSVFVYFLGKAYLGVNGLFNSIIGILSLSELGIGPAIVYSLYKPLADDDRPKIKALVQLYKRIYAVIGVVVALLGLSFLPFIPNLVGKTHIPYITVVYILFLINSVISYFFSYNSSLLNADQKNYVIKLNGFVFNLLTSIFQILVLWLTRNFILYHCIAISFTLISNIILKRKVDKEYSYLTKVVPAKLSGNIIQRMKKNITGNVFDKIGSTIVITTDNIYISLFVNLITVGLYNNYSMIIDSAKSFIMQFTSTLTGTIGNLIATSDVHKIHKVFIRYNFVTYIGIFFSSEIFLFLLNDFISVWIGKSYLFSMFTVMLIVINYVLTVYKFPVATFISAYGLSWYSRWKVIFECIVNIIMSAFFLINLKLGINGVILGTICSNILISNWWEPYVLFKYGIKISMKSYLNAIIKQTACLIISTLLLGTIVNHIVVTGWIMLFVKGFIVVLLSLIIFVIIFGRSEEFKYTVGMITKILKRH